MDGLPFMPEMVAFCGRAFPVAFRASKVCLDRASFPICRFQTEDVVLLEGVRCDGIAHDGCGRGCLIFWKEAWLRKPDGAPERVNEGKHPVEALLTRTKTKAGPATYFCQSTQLPRMTVPLTLGAKLRRSWVNLVNGNQNLPETLRALLKPIGVKILRKAGLIQDPRGDKERTPSEPLNLQPGEWVEVKSLAEIRATLDRRGRNRGLRYSHALAPFCGRRFRVRNRIERMIEEEGGTLRKLDRTVILDDLTCPCHRLAVGGCTRREFPYWREIWLRRIQEDADVTGSESHPGP
jgi:hypothetical protein